MADVLRPHAAEYLGWRGDRASFQERRVLAQLTACGTAALGGHAWECDRCGAVQASYNSCRNRHCPTCRGAARAKWLERVRQDLLPVPYFHVVQTLPHEPQLDRLTLANRAVVYGLLCNRRRKTDLARCRALLAAESGAAAIPIAAPTTPTTPVAAFACTASAGRDASTRRDASTCPTCRRGRLVLRESWPRPTVWDLVARPSSSLRPRVARPAPRPAVARRIACERSMAAPVEDTS